MALTYTTIPAITNAAIDKDFTDNVFKQSALLTRLRKKQKKVSGGKFIQVPVVSSAPGDGGAFSDLDTLGIVRTDNMSAAVYNWKQYYQPIRISQFDLAQTSGDYAVLDLIRVKKEIAEMQMAENLSSGIFGDGTASSGKVITGLGAVISDSSTYGGIAVADMADWKAVVQDNAGAAITLQKIQALMGACSDSGKQSPTVLVGNQNLYNEIYSLFAPFQRIESEEMGKLGFNTLEVNGVPLLVDSHVAAGELLALNENYLNLFVHPKHDMRKETHGSLETSDSMLTKIFWYGNIGCSQRRRQGKLADILTSDNPAA